MVSLLLFLSVYFSDGFGGDGGGGGGGGGCDVGYDRGGVNDSGCGGDDSLVMVRG